MDVALPTGAAGRALALGLALAVLAALWFAVGAPLLGFYDSREGAIANRQDVLGRMQALAVSLPKFRAAAAEAARGGPPTDALVAGATDAVAGAALQEVVRAMAAKAGASLTSAETLPAQPGGEHYRRIGLRVSLNAFWPVLVHLLEAVEQGPPRMLVDDLQLHSATLPGRLGPPSIDASFTIYAFRLNTAGTGTEAKH